ncbi:hypothetical protein ACFE04_025338 [Oxalis oulophora]
MSYVTSVVIKASSSADSTINIVDTFKFAGDAIVNKNFIVTTTEKLEGKIFTTLDRARDQHNWELTVGCDLPGDWILHWGVTYIDDIGSEWDQPPNDIIPPASILVNDYAIETPLKKSSKEDNYREVKIDFSQSSGIAAINFVLKDNDTGTWYQNQGRDFKLPLVSYLQDDRNVIGTAKISSSWRGPLAHLLDMLLKPESKDNNNTSEGRNQEKTHHERFYEELIVSKEVTFENSVSVSVKKCLEKAKILLLLETDLPGDVVIHWGVCRDNTKRWEIPDAPYPPETTTFKSKALQTFLRPKEEGSGCSAIFTLDEEFEGFLFVFKLNEKTWVKSMNEKDFYVPLSSSSSSNIDTRKRLSKESLISRKAMDVNKVVSQSSHTDGIVSKIQNLVSGISSDKGRNEKSEEQILLEVENLSAEAYSTFRTTVPTSSGKSKSVVELDEVSRAAASEVQTNSGTGTGFEILCQGFNWESHKSGRWYMELKEKAERFSLLGFSVIWLPPPTESVSPEGYMPKDLYNLNSRYGSIDELKDIVEKFHEVGIKVLGDAVLNHRCAHSQNQNGVWNIFGGRLNWDDRAVVGDDPHFQGKGNKSSGDNFHAAPNIDHSQEFVREDIKEWLRWLRKEIGYDGWRLDFVRGFWGGYVKDYLEASEPFFVVGEYWDSLSYTYGEMDHNQDAHRQRIIDWINATNGTAGAFDVTTKGILHSALERCEYWRLSDQKGQPPGVMGWWPSRAVTFIENHDTGSTQGHWRFPGDKEMQGYAYILTHPGTPSVFFDHVFSHQEFEIANLIALRKRNKLHCRSKVQIIKAENDVYGAIIDEKVAMKIGPGHFEPPSGPKTWSSSVKGRNYKVWEAL